MSNIIDYILKITGSRNVSMDATFNWDNYWDNFNIVIMADFTNQIKLKI